MAAGNKTVFASLRFVSVFPIPPDEARVAFQRHYGTAARDSAPSRAQGHYLKLEAPPLLTSCAGCKGSGSPFTSEAARVKRVRRFNAGYKVIERRSKCVEIAARVGTQTLNLLEWRIVGSVAKNTCRGCYSRNLTCLSLRQSEIQQNDLPARQ